ncbi:flagellar hook-associated protein FlgL [Terribacillus saccharophilus]|uniref:Flagellar hook-associated protein FlgL n=1 Tax=Terribacillus saccharophilus TaxID=361277 RepID=A0A268AF64_9BACI|nr:flagellar hook-associated protein FlgL [Terribacillus saccharophilus]PAD22764.1 flagellar hook-associated protein FlgL [Terribacillus saccharophilus]PAF18059.1 flagellar hook-associated protein FlgL [Terribacillus saccharophilus]PAF23665.1 flagellar hook-associated protein FlgL [Terribacillus saccharophilus]PAF37342.1 flagellar hook-associated protein FlgL [Terribacillus saccharophilus]PAF39820.1 flagellar hook-associated protein FlgL [Terribacillus saccharophilus]
MRITQSMMSNSMLRNLSNSYSDLNKYTEQLSSGKKITKPSDDPVVATKGMSYRTEVRDVAQYKRNLSEAQTWIDNSDSALSNATSALQRLRELAVQASNGTYEEGQRGNIAEEVDQLKEQLATIANTQVNEKYIFNGSATNTAPVTINEDGSTTVDFNSNAVNLTLSKGVDVQINVDGGAVFGNKLFDDLNNFSAALRSNGSDEDLDQYIGLIDENINNLVNERADIGARMNRMDLVESRLGDQELSATELMSNNEDAEMEEVIMNLTSQEAVHRAAMSAGARIIQPTLMDFLR